MPQFSMAGSVEEQELGLRAFGGVVFATVAVGACAGRGGEGAAGGLGGLRGVGW